MSHIPVASIAVFSSDQFDISWPAEGQDPNEPPLGRDVAVYFVERLRERGFSVVNRAPVKGEGGWHVRVRWKDNEFSLFVHWIPFETMPCDRWALQIKTHRGLIQRVFSRTHSHADIAPIQSALKDIIASDSRLDNVQWLTEEQFRELY